MATSGADTDTLLLRVFREQRPWLWCFLVRHVAEEEAAIDALHDVFIDTWENRADLGAALMRGDRDAVRRFAWRAARSRAIDAIRADTRRRSRTDSLHAVEPDGSEPRSIPLTTPAHADCLDAMRESIRRLRDRRLRRCLRRWLEGADLVVLSSEQGVSIAELRALVRRGCQEVVLRSTHRLRTAAPEPRS